MNYEELGFKAGLEIHQQLPHRKLFSHEPTEIRKDTPDFKIKRKLRARAGESGAVDAAAKHEESKKKLFEYRGYYDTDSLVEIDEEPPHDPCPQAIHTALQVAKLLHLTVADSLQFMRKIVIDGSNVSGFQRTGLVGFDGWIEVDGRRIGIESVCLEEEACQVIERKSKKDVYNLSRLGIPLLEIATAPDITSPEECKKVAAEIGMLLRSTERVKRGLGTIRQDVNVSIENGARTEIKGFQDYRNIPAVVKNEVLRQQELIQSNQIVEKTVRKAEEDHSTTYLRPMPGSDRMYLETDVQPVPLDIEDVPVPTTIRERQNIFQSEYDVSEDMATQAVSYEIDTGMNISKRIETYSSSSLSATNIIEFYAIKSRDIPSTQFEKYSDIILEAISDGQASYNAVDKMLEDVKAGNFSLENYTLMDEARLEDIIAQIIANNPDAPQGALMGMIMKETQGKADGATANQILQRLLH